MVDAGGLGLNLAVVQAGKGGTGPNVEGWHGTDHYIEGGDLQV